MNQKGKIIKLVKAGYSIPKVSKKLKVAKSSIYYHYEKIKGRKYGKALISNDDKVIGEFLGIFAGGGNFHYDEKYGHHTISIFLTRR